MAKSLLYSRHGLPTRRTTETFQGMGWGENLEIGENREMGLRGPMGAPRGPGGIRMGPHPRFAPFQTGRTPPPPMTRPPSSPTQFSEKWKKSLHRFPSKNRHFKNSPYEARRIRGESQGRYGPIRKVRSRMYARNAFPSQFHFFGNPTFPCPISPARPSQPQAGPHPKSFRGGQGMHIPLDRYKRDMAMLNLMYLAGTAT